jgi:hypothetical protein
VSSVRRSGLAVANAAKSIEIRRCALGALEELGLMEADVGALALDRLEKRREPEPRRAPPPSEFAELAERAKGRWERDRWRRETVRLAEARTQHLVESVDAGEAIGSVAERLGISVEAADQAHAFAAAHPTSPLPSHVVGSLGRRKQGRESAAMVEALGGEDEVDALASELAEGLREAA